MAKGSVLYSNIGKRATDILYRDYHNKSITTYNANRVGITTPGIKKVESLLADLADQLKNKNITADIKVDSNSNVLATIIVDEPATRLKSIFSITIPYQKYSNAELQYLHEYVYARISASLGLNPIVNFSGVPRNNCVSLGAELQYDTVTGNFPKFNGGLSIKTSDLIASLTALYANINTAHGAELAHNFSRNENPLHIGTQHESGPLTVVRTRVNNYSKVRQRGRGKIEIKRIDNNNHRNVFSSVGRVYDYANTSTSQQQTDISIMESQKAAISPRYRVNAILCHSLDIASGLLFGYNFGGALMLTFAQYRAETHFPVILAGFVTSGVASTLVTYQVSDFVSRKIGVKYTVMSVALLYIPGIILFTVVPSIFAMKVSWLVLALFQGHNIVHAYVEELCPSISRGSKKIISDQASKLGSTVAYMLFYYFNFSWWFLALLGLFPVIVVILGVCCLPESPDWLIKMRRDEDAQRVLFMTSPDRDEADRRFDRLFEKLRKSEFLSGRDRLLAAQEDAKHWKCRYLEETKKVEDMKAELDLLRPS